MVVDGKKVCINSGWSQTICGILCLALSYIWLVWKSVIRDIHIAECTSLKSEELLIRMDAAILNAAGKLINYFLNGCSFKYIAKK